MMTDPATTTIIDCDAMDEFLRRAADQQAHPGDLQRLCDTAGIELRRLLDILACRVAEKYRDSVWSYASCDRAMQELFRIMRDTGQCPDLAFSIFFAFCAGEGTTRTLLSATVPGRDWLRSGERADMDVPA